MTSEPSKSRFGVTADDLHSYDWQARLEKHAQKDYRNYYEVFVPGAQECEKTGDELGVRVYSFLNAISSFLPNYDSAGNHYGPRRSGFDGTRALMAEDLAESDLVALKRIVETIADAEFRARVADLLWECKRDYKAAQIAVDAYLESAENHKTDDLWPPYAERLERAIQLAAKLGFGKELHGKVLTVIEEAIQEFDGNLESGLLCLRLIEIAVAHTKGQNVATYAIIAEKLANQFQVAEKIPSFSENYWQLAEECHRQAKNPAEAQRCKLALGECYVTNVETSLKVGRICYATAAHWMGKAVQCLRDAYAPQERITEIHRRFLELESLRSSEEMKLIDIDVDQIPGFRDGEKQVQAAAREAVSGYDFSEAVARLARITAPVDVAEVRKQIEAQGEEFIWDKLVASEALDATGKVTDVMSPLGFRADEDAAITLRKKAVLQMRQIHWKIEACWKIDPARQAILEEHAIRLRSLVFLVENNPFIPPGHEGIYLRGLQAGFFGDWLVAMHLLIPQLEASLRYVLQQNGVVTATLKSDGIQGERDLNEILWMPETENIFGIDITFNLRGILIERFGCNMRNEMAHGLMSEGAFYHEAAVCLWWLVLHLCWIGFRFAQHPQADQ